MTGNPAAESASSTATEVWVSAPALRMIPSARFARLLDPVDELALVIGLPELDLQVERCGAGQASLLDIGPGIMPINRRIPHPEQIEVGAVQNIDRRQ